MAENISKTCRECGQGFKISPEDLAFYKKIGVPEPTLCPGCRQQRRLAFRNEKNLYKRACDLCGSGIISFFDKDVKFPVYCSACWWSDKWDSSIYGRDYDFSRPFFEQFGELMQEVPKVGVRERELQ
ncbi:zinc-ribbon domain containing protein [Candidatus Peregrinibacteria bacterium]|nr:zinc-ribbon domain containing protein [Candidatus Peregrinibacteria bacterium]